MKKALEAAALDTLFREARSYNRWSPEPCRTKPCMPFTNCSNSVRPRPLLSRAIRLRGRRGSQGHARRLRLTGKCGQVEQAPVTVIIGMDEKFYDKIPLLFPHQTAIAEAFKDLPSAGFT